MPKKLAALAALVVVVALVATAAAVLLLRDDSPGEAAAPAVELRRERESLGRFPEGEAIERAGELVGFELRVPAEMPGSVQLAAVQAWTGGGPLGIDPRYADLWYEVPGAPAGARDIQVQLFSPAPETTVGSEWETETFTVGSTPITVHRQLTDPGFVTFVVRFPGAADGFDVTAPAALEDEALELTRAFVEAYGG